MTKTMVYNMLVDIYFRNMSIKEVMKKRRVTENQVIAVRDGEVYRDVYDYVMHIYDGG